MLKHLLVLVFLIACSVQSMAQYAFIENKNQWNGQALFRAEIPNGYLFLEERGFSYLFYDPSSFSQHLHGAQSEENPSHRTDAAENGVRGHVVRISLQNAQKPEKMEAEATFSGHYNFLLGNDPQKWGRKAKSHGKITYKEVYPAIDLSFLQQEQDLKYEFRVKPHANPSQIQLIYEGQEAIYLHEKHLYIKTSVNAMKEERPYCYQVIDGLELEIESEFLLEGNKLSFHFPAGYDADYELVIDPRLVFSTYSGSFQDNWGFTATPDSEGHLYAGGMARGTGAFPITTGAFQEAYQSTANGTTDIAITKYSPDGTSRIYSTYLGGLESDLPHSLIVNSKNQLVILGSTSSANFPVSPTAFDATFASGSVINVFGLTYSEGSDMFITILSEDGSDLVGSTFWGGTDNDGISQYYSSITRNYGDEFRGDIILDAQDNIYVASLTESDDFPIKNALQSNLSGEADAVVAKFNADLSDMEWGTYLGGDALDVAYGIKLNALGQVVLAGGTTSRDFPTTTGVLHEDFSGGSTDGFVSIIEADGSAIVNATYIGTDLYDQAYLLDIEPSGDIAIFGQTLGAYPVSSDVFSTPLGGQFIHSLSADLSTTNYSTTIGSIGNTAVGINIRPTAFLVNECGNIYFSGWGGSVNYNSGNTNNMPTTPEADRAVSDGSDFYLGVLSARAESLILGTYFGNATNQGSGDHVDGGTARFDKRGIVYQSVCSCGSTNGFPTTPGVVSNINNSPVVLGNVRCNNAAFKYDLSSVLARVFPTIDSAGVAIPTDSGCAPLALIFQNDSIQGVSFEWDFGDGTILTKTENTLTPHTFQNEGVYVVSLSAFDSTTCQKVALASDIITVFPSDFTISTDASLCPGDSVQLTATGGTQYTWSPSIGLSDSTSSQPIAFPTQTTVYQLFAENAFGCTFEAAVTLTVPFLEAGFDTTMLNACNEFPELQVQTQSSSTAQSYNWFLNGNSISPSNPNDFILDFSAAGNYQLILEVSNQGCSLFDTLDFELEVNANFLTDIEISAPSTICQGDTISLFAKGGDSYIWQPSGTLTSPFDSVTLAFPSVTTEYQIRITGGRADCFLDTSLTITVLPNPQLSFSADLEDVACGEIPNLKFTNNSTNSDNFQWSFSTGESFTGRDLPIFTPQDTGTLVVILTAGEGICQQSDTLALDISKIGLPPNAFSPNGDGVNETFVIENITNGWKLAIYDRWGSLVYQTESYQNNWTGGDNRGEVFFYHLTSPNGNTCRGVIHVFR